MDDNIKELELKRDFEIIKPYLTSLGYDFSLNHEYDLSAYYIARKDNLRYLSFKILNYIGDLFGEFQYKSKFGQIIYDINGNILLDCINKSSKKSYCLHGTKRYYNELDSNYIFMDNYVLIDTLDKNDCKTYSIYKLENGKYSFKKNLKCERGNIIKLSNNELFLNNDGRLYGVREQKYLNNLKFKDIIGSETKINSLKFDIDRLCFHSLDSKTKDAISDKIKNNNLLFAYDYIKSNYGYWSLEKSATIFVFLDYKGKIVSKLYYKSENEFCSFDVNNSTYNKVVEDCVKKLTNQVKRNVDIEERRRKRELDLIRKSEEKMDNEIIKNFDLESNKVLTKTLKK